ncbi:MAG: zinc ribbon domain-containing protein [Spirochaetaceae bacterium]|jgi:putative FmdB family regulatory protein|nr:zinc ribbon domain-containing protein [Spirochaetaceae bacterium]
MPTYEYECKSCGHNFEAFQSMTEEPLKECPRCGKEIRRLINGGGGIIFKGSGFYVTDKGKGGTKTASKPGDAPASSGEKSKEAPAGSAACASCPAAAAAGGCPAPQGSEKAAG